ncbi:PX domain-containing protein F17H10.3 [Toxocara canis]|uniref:PX domain-containing protein F17H10.3 n=1 Tax=Toxocara canis TaxID=6265 RepID=A0A0B2VLS4_TOXCA|nr:PX domain-containing protein F17H10.3 [Toxocara canis]
MIHITIPDTQTLVEADGTRKYDAFNLHVNGAYHASIRYSQLLRLHEKLRDQFGMRLRVADFPPKKLFKTLDKKSLNERRIALARYFQSVVQLPDVALHFITEHTFVCFQVESFRPSSSNVLVDVYMADGTKEVVRCNVEHPTDIILKRFADAIGLGNEYLENFGLFLARGRNANSGGHFAPSTDSPDYPDLLCWFCDFLVFVRFLRLCHLQPGYSYEILEPCISDYPSPDTQCNLKIGRRHIVLEYDNPAAEHSRVEAVFRATRIRMWRITEQQVDGVTKFLFQFEYLVAKDSFEWITLITNQAVLISLLLQSIGIEILKEHHNATFSSYEYERSNKTGSLLGMDSPRKLCAASLPQEATDLRDSKGNDGEKTVAMNGSQHPLTNGESNEHVTDEVTSTKSSSGDMERDRVLNEVVDSRRGSSVMRTSNSYESFSDLFTTISSALPEHRNRAFNITDDDL